MSRQTTHKRDQALNLFLGEIGIRRHSAAFANSNSSPLYHGPDPVVGGGSLPVGIGQVLGFLG
jgi:hypothetical protein